MTACAATDEGQARFGGFAAALLDPDMEIPDAIGDASGRSSPKRFGIYRNNVVVSLLEALGAAYPAVRTIMGEDNFRMVCRNHVLAHPPTSALMMEYGAQFPDFLDCFPPLAKSPFLGDVARVERAWLEAYHAADCKVLAPGALSGIDQDDSVRLVFAAHPATAIVESDWPVIDLFGWRAGRPDSGADLGKPQCALITRPGLDVQIREIDVSQAAFLGALIGSTPLGEAAANVTDRWQSFDLAGTIAIALDSGMFARETSLGGHE